MRWLGLDLHLGVHFPLDTSTVSVLGEDRGSPPSSGGTPCRRPNQFGDLSTYLSLATRLHRLRTSEVGERNLMGFVADTLPYPAG